MKCAKFGLRWSIAITSIGVAFLWIGASPAVLAKAFHKPITAKSSRLESDDANTVRLQIDVTGEKTGKAVANASVYVRFPEKPGSSKNVELDLKTDEEGHVKVPPIPQGKILVQVVAHGYRTFGKWYEIDKPEDEIQIALPEPPHWY